MENRDLQPSGVHVERPADLESKPAGLEMKGVSVARTADPDLNEDSIAFDPTDGFAIVLDGVGGLENGEIASKLARDTIVPRLCAIPHNATVDLASRKVRAALVEASKRVYTELSGGTTATVVKFIEENGQIVAIIAHVGDSRAYLYREGVLNQITEDDNQLSISYFTSEEKRSLAGKLDQVATYQELNRLPKYEQSYFDHRNVISAMIGDGRVKPHTYRQYLVNGDRLVLTSDGVHDNLTKTEIEQILQSESSDVATALVERAKARSSESEHLRAKPDDISAIVVDVKPRTFNSVQRP